MEIIRIDRFVRAHFGYHFANDFPVHLPLPGFDVSLGEMGFCGGMSAGALHNFNLGILAPATTETPLQGTPLFEELLRRQLRSLEGSVLPSLLDCQIASEEGIGARTATQWPLLRDRIREGKPTMLVLIRTEGYATLPTDNHQVLAYGYSWNDATQELAIDIYDPNETEPGTLCMNLSSHRICAVDSCGERLRGFFVNPQGDHAAS